MHDRWKNNLWRDMFLLIAGGSLLSWFLNRNAGQIAIASFIAFAGSGVADTLFYWLLGDKAKIIKINGSNIASASVDSLIFPVLAFGFPVLWLIVIGQFAAKILGGFVWSIVLNFRHFRLLSITRSD